MPKKESDMGSCEMCHGHGKKGWTMLVIGLIALYNAYWPFMDWAPLIGIVLVILGIIKLAMPCPCCK